MKDSPIFIVGCPRSGTSLLRDLLRSHPRLTFPGESHFIPAFFKAYGDPQNEREARRLAARILRLRWLKRWGLPLDPAQFSRERSYRRIVCRIYQEWARSENKPRWGDKTPQYVTEIPTLLEIFPAGKIIHIYRDGRDVALSWLRTKLGPANLYTAASSWKELVSTGRNVGARLSPKTYLEVRYEALLVSPKEIMKRICEFVGEPFTEEVLKPNSRRTYPSLKFGLRHFTEIIDTNMNNWKSEMSLSDRILFESVAGDLLESLDYETEGRVRRISKPEQLMWTAHHYFWWLLKRTDIRGKYGFFNHLPTLWMKWSELRYGSQSARKSEARRKNTESRERSNSRLE
jgi:hypothetical protein